MKKEMIKVKGSGFEVDAYVADPEKGKVPAIIVIEEIWGLNENIKSIADRFAGEGYLALAPELLGEILSVGIDPSIMREMADPAKKDEAQKKMRAALAPTSTPEFAAKTVEKLEECFRFLKNHANSNGSVSVIGFCFGGTYSFALAGREPELKAAVALYGHPPEAEVVEKMKCPVLALYGEKDERLIGTLPQLTANMQKYGKNFKSIVYKNTGHGFFNDKNPMLYNKEAATAAWEEIKEFLR